MKLSRLAAVALLLVSAACSSSDEANTPSAAATGHAASPQTPEAKANGHGAKAAKQDHGKAEGAEGSGGGHEAKAKKAEPELPPPTWPLATTSFLLPREHVEGLFVAIAPMLDKGFAPDDLARARHALAGMKKGDFRQLFWPIEFRGERATLETAFYGDASGRLEVGFCASPPLIEAVNLLAEELLASLDMEPLG